MRVRLWQEGTPAMNQLPALVLFCSICGFLYTEGIIAYRTDGEAVGKERRKVKGGQRIVVQRIVVG